MADATQKQSESMEDILQSIKRIIEDDGDGAAKPAAAPVPTPAAAATDILELTQVIKDDGTIHTIPPLPTIAAKPEPASEPAKAEAPPVSPPAPKPAKTLNPEDSLMSDQAAQAAAAALRPLAEGGIKDFSIPRIPSTTLRNGNTVEDLVLEALRPMLKTWLDENLATIVKKIVEKEVKRIVTFNQD
jgi:cell pole-organizing protein PopZ